MFWEPDIWTFVDASIGFNTVSGVRQGAYGFIHMVKDVRNDALFAQSSGIRLAKSRNIGLLEAAAMYDALTEINLMYPGPKILIITDSNNVFHNIHGYLRYGIDPHKGLSDYDRLIMQCAELYLWLKNHGKIVEMELCLAHCQPADQYTFLNKNGSPWVSGIQYAKHICCGNSLIDYYTNWTACHANPDQVQQYGNCSNLFTSNTEIGYGTLPGLR